MRDSFLVDPNYGGVTPQDAEAIRKREHIIRQTRHGYRNPYGQTTYDECQADNLARFYSPDDTRTLLEGKRRDEEVDEEYGRHLAYPQDTSIDQAPSLGPNKRRG